MGLGIGRRWVLVGVAGLIAEVAAMPVSVALPVRAVVADVQPTGTPARCNYDSPVSLQQTADDLLHDRYHLGQHPPVTLSHDLTWAEDPQHDRQWRQKLQQLRFVMALMYRWQDTGDARYRDIRLLRQECGVSSESSTPTSTPQRSRISKSCRSRACGATSLADVAYEVRLHEGRAIKNEDRVLSRNPAGE